MGIRLEIVKDTKSNDKHKKLLLSLISIFGARLVIKWKEFKAKTELQNTNYFIFYNG